MTVYIQTLEHHRDQAHSLHRKTPEDSCAKDQENAEDYQGDEVVEELRKLLQHGLVLSN